MLKKCAFLKAEGKKDIKPARVAVIELGDSLITVVYLFPRSAKPVSKISASNLTRRSDAWPWPSISIPRK